MAVDFRCWNWKCERCVEWWKRRWKEHLSVLVKYEKMPDCLAVLQFVDKDWRYIRDRITRAGGQYLRVMVGRETYRVYATNLPNAREGSLGVFAGLSGPLPNGDRPKYPTQLLPLRIAALTLLLPLARSSGYLRQR